MIVHQIVDLFEKFAVIEEYETSEDKRREQFNVFVDQSLPQYLQLLENFVAQRGSSLLVNNKVTWADLAFAAFFNQLEAKKDFVLFPYPHLKEIDSQVNSLPQIVQLKQLSKQNTRFNY
jgi:glutathione S-transferase